MRVEGGICSRWLLVCSHSWLYESINLQGRIVKRILLRPATPAQSIIWVQEFFCALAIFVFCDQIGRCCPWGLVLAYARALSYRSDTVYNMIWRWHDTWNSKIELFSNTYFIFKQFCFLQPILACWATHCHGLQLLQLKMLAWVSCPCWCRNCLLWSSEVPSNRLLTSNLLQRCLFRVLPQLLPW